MNIIAGIVVLILFIITFVMFWQTVQNEDKTPFGMAMWLFIQMIIDFIVAMFLFKI